MWVLEHDHPWLQIRFPRPMRSLGWTPQGGGAQRTRQVLWRAVRNEDLTPELDITTWLAAETAARDAQDCPCFLTSARIADHAVAEARREGITARALATAGLGNAERIGERRATRQGGGARVGTLNLLLALSAPLSLPAALEALSLMAEARTAAMLERAPALWPVPPTGTGTDCLCLVWPEGPGAELVHAGKHTALGEAVGRAAFEAFSTAISRWRPPSKAAG